MKEKTLAIVCLAALVFAVGVTFQLYRLSRRVAALEAKLTIRSIVDKSPYPIRDLPEPQRGAL
jgi:hypothetical protein